MQKGEKAGSLPGAILLIAGCCIGAGMLGLPVLTALTGFVPSLLMFLVSWLFMCSTALLLLEVNLRFKEDVNIITMAGRTLGRSGVLVAWVCFLFLFYAIGVAYLAGSGDLISGFALENFGASIPHWVGTVSISLLFGAFVYLGTRSVDLFNRWLMIGLAVSYLLLVVTGMPYIKMEYLKHTNWGLAAFVLPIMIISFGFHNLIPSLTTYLGKEPDRCRTAILCGSAIPLFIYLVWEWLILGLVPAPEDEGFLAVMEKGELATHILKGATGSSQVLQMAQYFALFAILTSFLGNSLSFVDFLADGWHIRKQGVNKLLLCCAVIVPPLLFSQAYPRIFLTALHYAGAFGAVVLFGILPALMCWSMRYRHGTAEHQTMLPGGKATLCLVTLFGLGIVALQFIEA